MTRDVPLDDWKTYLRWHALTRCRGLSQRAVRRRELPVLRRDAERPEADQGHAGSAFSQSVDIELGEGLGQLYVERAFPPEAKAKALAMVTNLQAALGDRLRTIDWMGDATRQQALRKLDAITIKIGYPDAGATTRRSRSTEARISPTSHQGEEFEFQRNLDKIGKPVDRSEWGMTPPDRQRLLQPAAERDRASRPGILQPPFFDAEGGRRRPTTARSARSSATS